MERPSRILFPLLLLLLVAASEMKMVVGERMCESPSVKFTGMCVSAGNCASICASEGFHSGICTGFRRRCVCSKPC